MQFDVALAPLLRCSAAPLLARRDAFATPRNTIGASHFVQTIAGFHQRVVDGRAWRRRLRRSVGSGLRS